MVTTGTRRFIRDLLPQLKIARIVLIMSSFAPNAGCFP
jgi:hypothetical protein